MRLSFTPGVRELTEGTATLHTPICRVLIGNFGAIGQRDCEAP